MITENSLTTDTLERFSFGRNWKNFLETVNEERILDAENSIKHSLNIESLKGKRFLDVGSGSGLFSLAAYRLGADVTSFDYDLDSVACTSFLRKKFVSDSCRWSVLQGSILDKEFIKNLEKFDIVYAWGVLHHTGNMNQAFENISVLVNKNGDLFISIYNDQGIKSCLWKTIKRTYNKFPFLRPVLFVPISLWLWKYRIAWGLVRYGNPIKLLKTYGKNARGMSAYYDAIDWIGGYPFEVAKPELVFDYFFKRGFSLSYLKTCGANLGCNEFVFKKLD